MFWSAHIHWIHILNKQNYTFKTKKIDIFASLKRFHNGSIVLLLIFLSIFGIFSLINIWQSKLSKSISIFFNVATPVFIVFRMVKFYVRQIGHSWSQRNPIFFLHVSIGNIRQKFQSLLTEPDEVVHVHVETYLFEIGIVYFDGANHGRCAILELAKNQNF